MTDRLLPRLDRDGRMILSVGAEFMSVAQSSANEFVRDMVGEVGGVKNISKSFSSVDMAHVTCF